TGPAEMPLERQATVPTPLTMWPAIRQCRVCRGGVLVERQSHSLLLCWRHAPPPGLAIGEPDDRLKRGVQYAARFTIPSPALTGSPAFAGIGAALWPKTLFSNRPTPRRTPPPCAISRFRLIS